MHKDTTLHSFNLSTLAFLHLLPKYLANNKEPDFTILNNLIGFYHIVVRDQKHPQKYGFLFKRKDHSKGGLFSTN
jgi:hypothetical protein